MSSTPSSSLFQYYNLLIFFNDASGEHHIIGEATSVVSFATNPAVDGYDVVQLTAYSSILEGVTTLVSKTPSLTRLPPGDELVNLKTLDINSCTNISSVPPSYSTLTTLRAASTKLSSIPVELKLLEHLDITNCKRIASVRILTLKTLIMSQSSVTEIANTGALLRLYALSTRLATIPASSTSLAIIVWSSSISGGTLAVDPACTSLISVLTTGPVASISTTNGEVHALHT